MEEFFAFRKLITPAVTRVLFLVGSILAALFGLGVIIAGVTFNEALASLLGLVYLVVGPLLIRVYCEFLIIQFRIYETLLRIENNTRAAQGAADGQEKMTT